MAKFSNGAHKKFTIQLNLTPITTHILHNKIAEPNQVRTSREFNISGGNVIRKEDFFYYKEKPIKI